MTHARNTPVNSADLRKIILAWAERFEDEHPNGSLYTLREIREMHGSTIATFGGTTRMPGRSGDASNSLSRQTGSRSYPTQSAISFLCERAGIYERALRRVMSESTWTSWALADKILCAIGHPEALVDGSIEIRDERMSA